MKNNNVWAVVLFVIFSALSFFSAHREVSAVAVCGPDYDPDPVGGVCLPSSAATGISDKSVSAVLTGTLNWLLGIVATLGVLSFVIAGIQYMTSAGNQNMTDTAKRNITWSIVGIAVSLLGLIAVNTIAGILGAG